MVGTCAQQGGPAVFVKLAPLADDRYRLIVAPVTIAQIQGHLWLMAESVHGCFAPAGTVGDFLADQRRAVCATARR